MDRHERALIDTGDATPSRKQLQAYTPKMSGPIGLARSQFFKLPSSLSSPLFSSHNRYHHFKSCITTGTIALSKAVVPIHTSLFGISRNLGKQILLMQLGIKQLL